MSEFEKLYGLYYADVFRYALSLCRDEPLAEEIAQETFFRALQSIGDFQGQCRVYVWLCQIAKNTYFSMLRKQKRISGGEMPERASDADTESEFIGRESALELQKAIHRMEEPYKEVLMLRIFGEMPFRRIGELFGKTESWARVTYHRAKTKLKENTI